MIDKKCLNVTNDSLTPKEEGVGKGVSNFTQTTEFQLYVLYPTINSFITNIIKYRDYSCKNQNSERVCLNLK